MEVELLVEMAKVGHRKEIEDARPARHDWQNCERCKAIMDAEAMVIEAASYGGHVVLYAP